MAIFSFAVDSSTTQMLIDAKRYQGVIDDNQINVFIFPNAFLNRLRIRCFFRHLFSSERRRYYSFTFDNMISGPRILTYSSCELFPLPIEDRLNPNTLTVNLLLSRCENLRHNLPMGYVPDGLCAILCSDTKPYVHFAFFTFSASATLADRAGSIVIYNRINIANGGGGGGAESTRIPAP